MAECSKRRVSITQAVSYLASAMIGICLAVICASWMHDRSRPTPEESQPPSTSYEVNRQEYERGLEGAPNKVSGDFILAIDDRRAIHTGVIISCPQKRCASISTTSDGSLEVRLPVSYSYTPIEGAQPQKQYDGRRVSKLTFWNPREHREEILEAPPGETIKLPDTLITRRASDTKEGEEAFFDVLYLSRCEKQRMLCKLPPGATAWYEPGGAQYGIGERFRTVRQGDGFKRVPQVSTAALLET